MTEHKTTDPRIRIVKDGPYIVTGKVPLGEKIIVFDQNGGNFKPGRALPQSEEYVLCRCGKSKDAPFCDGAHVKANFKGTETASKMNYEDRAMFLEGATVDLLDDKRCAFARLCHGRNGSTWELAASSDDDDNRQEAIRTASNCPAGRLTAVEKSGEVIEPVYEPGVDIIQDPLKGASGGIFVKGNIPLESADGVVYEIRNRYVLCRCGESANKPFCDAMHIPVRFSDDGGKHKMER